MTIRNRDNLLSAGYYALLILLVSAVLFQVLSDILPVGAKQVSHNTEAYTTAAILALWVQFARPRLHGSRWEWPVTWAVALCAFGVALLFYLAEEWPTRVTTLNEAFFALAALIPYVQPRRRHRDAALVLSGLTLALIVFGGWTAIVTDMAEALAVLLLAPLALDVFDRRVLDPAAPAARTRRIGWFAFLIVAPVVLHVLAYRIGLSGIPGDVVRYAVRFYEAFIFLLIFQLFFAVVTPRRARKSTGSPVEDRSRTAAQTP
ncbi:hypothetical protein ACGFNU_41370 [Spirillospora sp. NPDC048911]|uniref:hypothetical protein n=1 Tax=Spirillospora sp. NPDC048911 TaxID=3364527 RepID=UPI00371D2F7A